MPNIPQDVWYHVAKFLPESVLEKLLTVNPAFFDISMNIRYRAVYFRGLDTDETTRILVLLKDNAMVSGRVRRLHIHLEAASTIGARPVDRIPISRRVNERTLSVMRLISTIILGLKNVVELYVRARDRALHDCSQAIFTSAWEAFGDNLRILSIEGEINCLRIPLSIDRPGSVRELHLQLSDTSLTELSNTTLREVVMPLVNRFAPQIQHLLVTLTHSVQGHLNVSHFFVHLDALPNLQRLTVYVPFQHFTDFTGLTRILHDHAQTLKHLNLRLAGKYWTGGPTTTGSIAALMEEYTNDEAIFKNLNTLIFRPTTLGTCNSLITLLSRSADSLTELILLERRLDYEEVASITNLFAHRPPINGLKTICLTVHIFTPHLLTLLAINLRGLKKLIITCREWGHLMTHDVESDKEKLQFFREHLEERKQHFVTWGLVDIAIFRFISIARPVKLAHGELDTLLSQYLPMTRK